MKCPECGRTANVMYRNKPKGQVADQVCWECVPDHLKPTEDTVEVADDLDDVLNGRR